MPDRLRLGFTYATPTTDNGNLTSQTIAAPGFSQTQYYGYDGVNRLKAASEGAALVGGTTCPTTQSWCQEYGFDPFGNRWLSFSNRTLHMATPTSAANFNAATNRLTGSGITCDNAGNLTAHPFLTPGAGGGMVYNASNKMTQFTATGVSVSYRYDASERRVRQDSGGQTTIWVYDAFGQLAAEYSTNLTMVQGVYYRTTDHLGSTRIVTNQSAAVVQRRDFFPFGEAIPADSSHGNRQAVTDGGSPTYNVTLGVRQQFTGQQRDEDTGLDYFWARNLSGPLGRFLSVDSSGLNENLDNPQSFNPCSYVENNPLRYIDPNGEVTCGSLLGYGDGGQTLRQAVTDGSDRAVLAQLIWGESGATVDSAGYIEEKVAIAYTAINRWQIANGVKTVFTPSGRRVSPGYFGGRGTLRDIIHRPGAYHAFVQKQIPSPGGAITHTELLNQRRFDRILDADISDPTLGRQILVQDPVNVGFFTVNEECANMINSYVVARGVLNGSLSSPFGDKMVTHFQQSSANPDPAFLISLGEFGAHTFFGFASSTDTTYLEFILRLIPRRR